MNNAAITSPDALTLSQMIRGEIEDSQPCREMAWRRIDVAFEDGRITTREARILAAEAEALPLDSIPL